MKKRWIALLLILLPVFIGIGFYLNTAPQWTDRVYYKDYNEGMAALKNGDMQKSLDKFSYVVLGTKNEWLKSLALSQSGTIYAYQLFNKGLPPENRFEIAQYAKALLEEAVSINPDNEEAKYNLEFVLNYLSVLSQEMTNDQGNNGQPQPGIGYGRGSGDRGY